MDDAVRMCRVEGARDIWAQAMKHAACVARAPLVRAADVMTRAACLFRAFPA